MPRAFLRTPCSFLVALAVGMPLTGLGAGLPPGVAAVELHTARGGEIRRAEARWAGPDLLVRGSATRLHPSLVRRPVHVQVCGPDGTAHAEAEVSTLPRGKVGKGLRPVSFVVRLPIVEEHRAGLRVRVGYGARVECPGRAEEGDRV